MRSVPSRLDIRLLAALCGMLLGTPTLGAADSLTYHGRISRIVQDNCQACHRVGGLGPMPLETYRQVADRRAVIELMVGTGRMPPWFANKHVGEWSNDRSLPDKDKADLLAWIKVGAPEGDRRDAPPPRKFESGWGIGKPDYIVSLPKPVTIPATGTVGYHVVFVKTDLPTDKWVTAVQLRPTANNVVHHALAFLEEPGRTNLTPEELKNLKPGAMIRAQPSDGQRGFFAATGPRSLGNTYPSGTGKRLPKGQWIKFEIHYQPNGKESVDHTQLGFRFSDKPLREIESLSAFSASFEIPPFSPRHEVKAAYKFDKAGELLAFLPHMHIRGAAFRYDLLYPDGRKVALLDVPKYDFNWQSFYEAKKPIAVPAGAQLLATAWYDNSKANPWNPDPSKTVRWGVNTEDEMMIGYFDFLATGRRK